MAAPWTLTTWNVNSVRARLDHVATYLAEHEPDVLLLQETKVEDKLFPRVPFLELGYVVTTHGSKGQAGVATISKSKPTDVVTGFRQGEPDRHCRVLNTLVDGVRIYNLYVPNGQDLDSEGYLYKLEWLKRLGQELRDDHSSTDSVVLAGDFNIAPADADVPDADAMRGHIHFSPAEHDALAGLLSFGLRDCFRVGSDEAGVYSWFDYRAGAFQRGNGLRIDHVYATPPMVERVTGVVHDREPRGWDTPSDHLPVTASFAGR
jgi:exodeoxyribonuclease-3